MSVLRINFNGIFSELHKLIDMNKEDIPRRDKICSKVKTVIKTPQYVNAVIMELDTIFVDGLQFSEIPKLISVSLELNKYIANLKIKPSDMKYVVYAMLILYFNNTDEPHEFDTLREFYNDIFSLVLLEPKCAGVGQSFLSCI